MLGAHYVVIVLDMTVSITSGDVLFPEYVGSWINLTVRRFAGGGRSGAEILMIIIIIKPYTQGTRYSADIINGDVQIRSNLNLPKVLLL